MGLVKATAILIAALLLACSTDEEPGGTLQSATVQDLAATYCQYLASCSSAPTDQQHCASEYMKAIALSGTVFKNGVAGCIDAVKQAEARHDCTVSSLTCVVP